MSDADAKTTRVKKGKERNDEREDEEEQEQQEEMIVCWFVAG